MDLQQYELPLPQVEVLNRVCAVVVIRFIKNRPHILLAQRLSGPDEGMYTLPGGKVESGETLLGCACREIREEVGVGVDPDLMLQVKSIPIRRGLYNIFLYLVYWDEATNVQDPLRTEPETLEEWQWVSVYEAWLLSLEGRLPIGTFAGMWPELVIEVEEERERMRRRELVEHGWPR